MTFVRAGCIPSTYAALSPKDCSRGSHGPLRSGRCRANAEPLTRPGSEEGPRGVICLLSAPGFHELGIQSPFEVWLAIDRRAWKPIASSPKLRIVRFSGAALTTGIERQVIEGVAVPIYSPAKTVADCFKYRNKLGLDVPLEALREGLRGRRFTRDELGAHAKVCRVASVMCPYLEAIR